MNTSQYRDMFIDESREHLQIMNEVLLKLENNMQDIALVNEIFRTAHTIKGMSGTMGYQKLAKLTHQMENVLHLCRNQEMAIDSVIIDMLFECFDGLDKYVENLAQYEEEGELDTTDLVRRLEYVAKNKTTSNIPAAGNEQIETAVAEQNVQKDTEFHIEQSDITDSVKQMAAEGGFNATAVKIVLAEDCVLKIARVFMAFNSLEKIGEVIKTHPSTEDIEDEKFERSIEALVMTKADQTVLRETLLSISEIEDVFVKSFDLAVAAENTMTTETQVAVAAPLVTKQNQAANSASQENKQKKRSNKTVRVDIERLDNLMNLVSELIIIKTRLDDNEQSEKQSKIDETLKYFERITTALHDAVMKVRMVPVERTFNRFPRMVRDLAKKLDKSIDLIVSGEETEVDRTVIDEIGDPLIHLIRNSIDHGVESKSTRLAKGKPEVGTVHLRAYPDGNSVVLEVEDDGNGIDPEIIAQKALQKGLFEREELEAMTKPEIINLLFAPGFSTAEKVTDVSGRGVGLDVVKTKIESLSGEIEVQSEVGLGSKFVIRLPLTLAIIQALMISLGSEKYAIPLTNIRIITMVKPSEIRMLEGREIILYRNKTLPLVRLSEVLDVPDASDDEELLTVVIVKKGDREIGIVVDGLIGQQEIVIKSLGCYLNGLKIISGATIMGNGSVVLILDTNQLF